MKNSHVVMEMVKSNQYGVVSRGSDENAETRFWQFILILLNLGGKVIVVPRFRDFYDAFILSYVYNVFSLKNNPKTHFPPRVKVNSCFKAKKM